MQGFIKFNRGIMRMHWTVKLWVMTLAAANMLGPLFFLGRLEAQVVLAVMMVSATLMAMLTARYEFTRILGLGHILWFPLLGWLLIRLDQIPATDAFGLWIRGLICVNAISLVMDVTDVIRYIRGDRSELITDS